MNPNKPFRDKAIVDSLLKEIKEESAGRNYKIMEVCGTHTMSISRNGIRSLLPSNVELVSGPGCPVCVTPQGEIDLFFQLIDKGATVVTFGDLLKIPDSKSNTLATARAAGADVRIIYSPIDTVKLAEAEPDKKFVFLGVGFETTAPIIAYLAKAAKEKGLKNLFVLALCKTMPEAIKFILNDDGLDIDGFLCPGHVSIVTGVSMYDIIVHEGKAAVVTGFEPVEILAAILEVIRQVNTNHFATSNQYKRVVSDEGNPVARAILQEVFEPVTASWRGLGELPESGLGFKKEYAEFDARHVFNLVARNISDVKGCKCGSVLTGKIRPDECPLFGKVCTTENPVGPCMVSSEGTCAAYYRFVR